MAQEMDAGDIINMKKTKINENETSGDLFDRLSILGAELLSETIQAIGEGRANRTGQKHEEATFAPPLTKELCPVDWTRPAQEIINKIRGLNPLADCNGQSLRH